MDIKALSRIRHNGIDYKPGSIVPGLTQEEYDRLIKLGDGEVPDDSRVQAADESKNSDDNDDYVIVLSVDDFSKLSAPEQKEHLKDIGFEPAGKEEDRIAQYEDWYAEQVTGEQDA